MESTGRTTKELYDIYGQQVAKEYEVHLFRNDEVEEGHIIQFNTANEGLGIDFNPSLSVTRLEVKKIDYGYKDHKMLTCITDN